MAEQHGERKDLRGGVGDTFSCDVWGGTVHGLIQTEFLFVQACRWQKPSEPTMLPPKSLKISPNILSVTITSNVAGAFTSCTVALSMNMKSRRR